MIEPVETIQKNELTINLFPDDDTESPEDWNAPDNGGVFIVTTQNRHFTSIPKGWSVAAIAEYLTENKRRLYKKDGKYYHVFQLFAYIHSGVSLSLGRGYPFNDPWDSGMIGFALVERGAIGRRSTYQDAAEGLVKTWNQFLSGEVYGFVIKDSENNNLDSCWGFYGLEYTRTQALVAADYCLKGIVKDRVSLSPAYLS